MKKKESASEAAKKSEVNTYDSRKNYKWEPTDTFSLSGQEFGMLLNSLRAILQTPEAQTVLLADKANNIIEQILARSVANGVVKEDPREIPSPK